MKSTLSAQFDRIKTPDNAIMVEAIDEGYALIEGWLGDTFKKIGSAFKRGRDALMRDPAKVDMPAVSTNSADRAKIREDKETLGKDLNKYMGALGQLVDMVRTYGAKAFNMVANEGWFRRAYAEGNHLDRIRKNPMIEAILAGREYVALLEGVSRFVDRKTLDDAARIFLEANELAAFPMMEGVYPGYTVALNDISPENIEVTYDSNSRSFVLSCNMTFDGYAEGQDDGGWSIEDTQGDSPTYNGILGMAIPDLLIRWNDCDSLPNVGMVSGVDAKIAVLKELAENIEFVPFIYKPGAEYVKLPAKMTQTAAVLVNFAEHKITVDLNSPDKICSIVSISVDPDFPDDIDEARSGEGIPFGEAVSVPRRSNLEGAVDAGVMASMRGIMAEIADFIAKHGTYTWEDFMRSPKWRDAFRAGRNANTQNKVCLN